MTPSRLRETPMKRTARLAAALVLAIAVSSAASAQGPAPAPKAGQAVATFAGGCFWCMEGPYDKLPGVLATTSGYMGGAKKYPTYEEVSSGMTGHAEVVQVLYDPSKVSYDKLLEVFWVNVDPTVTDRQFCDHGTQYRTAIFAHTPEQRKAAEASKAAVEKSRTFKEAVVTPVIDAGDFWPAEDYHQDYYKKNPARYTYYRTGCGRDARLKELWGAKAGH